MKGLTVDELESIEQQLLQNTPFRPISVEKRFASALIAWHMTEDRRAQAETQFRRVRELPEERKNFARAYMEAVKEIEWYEQEMAQALREMDNERQKGFLLSRHTSGGATAGIPDDLKDRLSMMLNGRDGQP